MTPALQTFVRVDRVLKASREARGRTILGPSVEVYLDLKWRADDFDNEEMQPGAILCGTIVHGSRGPELREYVCAPTEFARASAETT